MTKNPLINEPVEALASRLEAMTDDDVFTTMSELERASEAAGDDAAERSFPELL